MLINVANDREKEEESSISKEADALEGLHLSPPSGEDGDKGSNAEQAGSQAAVGQDAQAAAPAAAAASDDAANVPPPHPSVDREGETNQGRPGRQSKEVDAAQQSTKLQVCLPPCPFLCHRLCPSLCSTLCVFLTLLHLDLPERGPHPQPRVTGAQLPPEEGRSVLHIPA